MNKRIKELWNEAAKRNAKLVAGPNSWETEVNFMNTFTELIVTECSNLCLSMKYVNSQPHHYAVMLKEHFGVE